MATTTDQVDTPVAPRRTRWFLIGLGVALLGLLGLMFKLASDARLTLDYEGPPEVTAPGDEVTVRATDGNCGPLIVSLHRQTILGLWNQTHSGNVIDGFVPDHRAWWSLGSATYFTPVPCASDGSSTFTLPEDLPNGVIAACDSGGCARIHVKN